MASRGYTLPSLLTSAAPSPNADMAHTAFIPALLSNPTPSHRCSQPQIPNRHRPVPSPPLDDPSRFDHTGSLHMPPLNQHGASELSFSPPSPQSSSQYGGHLPGLDEPEFADPDTPPAHNSPVSTATIDALSTHFEHTPAQRRDFHMFFRMGAGLRREDMLTRAYVLGHSFHVENKLDRREVDISALTNDLHGRLEVTFTLNKEQAANIRLVAQDLIYSSQRTSYLTLFLDVEALVRKDSKRLAITNVYGNPSRERVVSSSIKQICSSVRNGWRADIRDSCLGSKTTCLTEFTFESATKYKTGGPGKDLSALYSVHNALLRRFTYENPALVDRVEGEPEDDDAPNTREKDGRKHKKTAVARVKKGEDYWSCVDSWFTGLISAWGGDIGIGHWKEYIDETIQRDADRFPQVHTNYAINFAVPDLSRVAAPLQATTNTVAVPPAIRRGGLEAILNMT